MKPLFSSRRILAAGCVGVAALTWLAVAQISPLAHVSEAMAMDAPATHRPSAGPPGTIHAHVCGFHFYSGEPQRALRVEHYCAHLSSGVMQCTIYDSDRPEARLIGVEYIIGEAMFMALPAEEKRLWHSHRYEVMSGLLTAPDADAAGEEALMKELVNTYGKTWHLWQVDRGDVVPLGLPKLMMGFTADGQVDPALVAARDRAAGVDSAVTKARRADFPVRPIAEGADSGAGARAFQLSDAVLSRP